ncbi:MAG TPA: CoA pyrophosphatase [Anaerolineae bacterium]|nr:CoA pyrophosphatase [Anaerolineae bacterium]
MTVSDLDERRAFKARVQAILAGRERLRISDPRLRCAAVLLPLLWKKGQWHVAVTQRTHNVEHHRGQISFPGGACEAQDNGLLDTALRETHEEIGVPPEAVEVLGPLDDFPTITHFSVTPFVGVIPHPFPYRVNEAEVEAVVEVPLSFLLEPTHVRVEEREHEGQIYEVLFWDYQEGERTYTIWGATARTLRSFLDLIA